MVENKIIEEIEPEVNIPVPEKEQIIIDLSDVKVWNKKLERWFQVKCEDLTLFEENQDKCWSCGFYKEFCMCYTAKKINFIFLKKWEKKGKTWINNLIIRFHRYKYLKLNKKANKFYYKDRNKFSEYKSRAEEHERYYDLHRQFQELQINWKKINPKGFNIKLNGGFE